MSPDKQTTTSTAYQQKTICDDEISLIDVYLTVKRNSKLFFSVILLSFLISIAITYYKYESHMVDVTSSTPTTVTEHVLIIEIGRIYGENAGQRYIDRPTNTLEKIKNIYIPKLQQHSIIAEHIKKSDLIVIKATEISDKVNYNKILLTLADYILKDHNSGLSLNNKNSIKPTKIIQQPTKRIIENKNKNKNKNIILIPVLGFILGVFLAFFAIFINEFIKKAKAVENSI